MSFEYHIQEQKQRLTKFLDQERANLKGDSPDNQKIKIMLNNIEQEYQQFQAGTLSNSWMSDLCKVNACINKVNDLTNKVIDFINDIDIDNGCGRRGWIGGHGDIVSL